MIGRRQMVLGSASAALAALTLPSRAAVSDAFQAASPWSIGLGSRMRLIRGAPLGGTKPRRRHRDRSRAGFQDLLANAGQRRCAAGFRLVRITQSRVGRARLARAKAPGRSRRFRDRLYGRQCRATASRQRRGCGKARRARPVPQLCGLQDDLRARKGRGGAHLTPGMAEGLYSALIEAAAREVPKRVAPATLGLDRPQAAVLALGSRRSVPGFQRQPRARQHVLDIFVEGPENWLFGAPNAQRTADLGCAAAASRPSEMGGPGRRHSLHGDDIDRYARARNGDRRKGGELKSAVRRGMRREALTRGPTGGNPRRDRAAALPDGPRRRQPSPP